MRSPPDSTTTGDAAVGDMAAAVERAPPQAPTSFLGEMDDLDMRFFSDLLLPEDESQRGRQAARAQEKRGDSTSDNASSSSIDPLSSSDDGGATSRPPTDSPSPSGSPSGSSEAETRPRRAPPSRLRTEERRAKRRAQVAVSARRHRSRKKSELLALRAAESELGARLAELRAGFDAIRPSRAVAAAEELAVAERLKRQKVEQVNAELRQSLVAQRCFVGSLKAALMGSPMASAAADMRQLLHTYTHLGSNPWSRTRDFLSVCKDRKLDLAIQILLRETEGTDFRAPAISTRLVGDGDGEGSASSVVAVTATATYAFELLDLKRTFASACSAILGCGFDWPQFSTLTCGLQVAAAPAAHVRYCVSGMRYQSEEDGGVVAVDSLMLTCHRLAHDCGVFVWDFADRDDLFPLTSEHSVKRDIIGAAMLRRELCADGVERVVFRSICTKVHSFPSPPGMKTTALPAMARYAQSLQQGAKVCGAIVYNQIHADVARSLVAP